MIGIAAGAEGSESEENPNTNLYQLLARDPPSF